MEEKDLWKGVPVAEAAHKGRHTRVWIWKCLSMLCVAASACALRGQGFDNGDFEEGTGGKLGCWQPRSAYVLDTAVKKSGTRSIRCEASGSGECSGVVQEIVYPKPDKTPVVFGGWSKAENVTAEDYCIYLDIWYEDGSNAWGKTAKWTQSSHDWEYAADLFCPEKPVKKIKGNVFLRKGSGRVWFDQVFLERRQPGLEIKSAQFFSDYPHSEGVRVHLSFLKDSVWHCRTCNAVGGALQSFSGKGQHVCFITDGEKDPASVQVVLSEKGSTRNFAFTIPAFTRPKNPVKTACVVWSAEALRRVTPLTYPTEEEQADTRAITLDLARNERENAQVLVTACGEKGLNDVTVSLSSFVNADMEPLDGSVSWERIGYVAREPPFKAHPCGVPLTEAWLPDPLLPAAPFRVRKGSTQGVWLTAYAHTDAKPGRYTGKVTVKAGGNLLREIPVLLKVRSFANPKTFGLPTAFCVMDGFTRAQYPGRFEEMKRKSHDIMLAHRLNPDDISRTEPPLIEDLLYAREKGMNRFNILNMVPKPSNPTQKWVCHAPTSVFTPEFYDSFKARLTPYVAELKKHGLEKMAYVYGFDERTHEYYPLIDEIWRKMKTDFPEIPLMTTAKMYKDMWRGGTNDPCLVTTDWYCPVTYTFTKEITDQLKGHGKQVWWYTCCGPTYPFANLASLEYPWIEGRLLCWMTHQYRADGFLFWHVNNWPERPPLKTDDTYLTEWHTANRLEMPGDGIFLYPCEAGPIGSIRLAHFRDGIEDYEWMVMLRDAKGIAAVDELTTQLVQDLTHYDRDHTRLIGIRTRLADELERIQRWKREP